MRQSRISSSNIRSSLLAKSEFSSALQAQPINSSSLPQQLVQTIGDSSCPYIKKKNLYDIVADFTTKFRIIRPENKWLLIWHGFIMLILLYYIFQIGLLWGYGEAVWIDELGALYAVNSIFIAALIADCILSNFKAYYSHGLLVTHHRLIVKRYLRVRFYLDILAIVSIIVPVVSGKFALNWIKALFFLKFYSLYQIDKEFIRVTQLRVSYHTFYLLSRLVLFLVLGSHYLGIWFYMIDYWVYQNNYYGPNTPNICWIYNAESYSQLVLLQPWYGQYLYTMYFSIGTMTTIAYGDITPLNPIQVIYITLALLPYTIGFAYILSQILRILMEAQASKFEHTNNLLIVSNLMKNNLIKQKTQSKVKSYFEKVWKEQIYRNRQVQAELIQKLPYRIRNQLFSQMYYSFFISSGLYFNGGQFIVKTNFLVAISNQIREQRLVQDHVLYKQMQEYDPQNLNNHIFYFIKQIKKGKLKPSIQMGVKDLVIQTIAQGNVGIQGFYTGQPRDHWAKVILSVLVYQLPRKILLQNLHLATEIQQQNIFLNQQIISTQRCLICKQLGHHFKSCQYVTYQPDKKELIKHFSKINQLPWNSNNGANNNNQIKVNARKQKNCFSTMAIWKEIKNLKYKIKSKYQMMVSDKYYRQLFSKANRNKRKFKDDFSINIQNNKNKRNMTGKFSNRTQTRLSPKIGPQSPKNMIKQMNLYEQQQFMIQMKDQQSYQSHSRNLQKHKYHRAATLIPAPINVKPEQQQSSEYSSSSSSSSEQSVDLQNYLKETELYIRHLQHLQTNANFVKQADDEFEYDTAKQYMIYYSFANISNVINKFNGGNVLLRRNAQNLMISEVNGRQRRSNTARLSESYLSYQRNDKDNLLNESLDQSMYSNRNFVDPSVSSSKSRIHSMRYQSRSSYQL